MTINVRLLITARHGRLYRGILFPLVSWLDIMDENIVVTILIFNFTWAISYKIMKEFPFQWIKKKEKIFKCLSGRSSCLRSSKFHNFCSTDVKLLMSFRYRYCALSRWCLLYNMYSCNPNTLWLNVRCTFVLVFIRCVVLRSATHSIGISLTWTTYTYIFYFKWDRLTDL